MVWNEDSKWVRLYGTTRCNLRQAVLDIQEVDSMKIGDTVMYKPELRAQEGWWDRCGLVLRWNSVGDVIIFWGEDFSQEFEYPEDLEVV